MRTAGFRSLSVYVSIVVVMIVCWIKDRTTVLSVSLKKTNQKKIQIMKRIPIDKATPGMVLAEPVTSQTGAVLFPQGTELAEKHIERLKTLGIEVLSIVGKSEPRMSKERYLKTVERAFTRANPNPVLLKIKEALFKHINSLYEET